MQSDKKIEGVAVAPAPIMPKRQKIDETAFYFDNHERLDLERGIRSVSCLLSICSQNGNEDIDGFLAHGLSIALDVLAKQSRSLYSNDEMVERGGAPCYLTEAELDKFLKNRGRRPMQRARVVTK